MSEIRVDPKPSFVRFFDEPDTVPAGRTRLELLRVEREGCRSMRIWAELTAEIEAEMGRSA